MLTAEEEIELELEKAVAMMTMTKNSSAQDGVVSRKKMADFEHCSEGGLLRENFTEHSSTHSNIT